MTLRSNRFPWMKKSGDPTNAAKYLSKTPSRSDILSVYAGLRPLVKVGDAKSTAALSRRPHHPISNAGLLTIAGGKWTTYRKMAQDMSSKRRPWPVWRNAL